VTNRSNTLKIDSLEEEKTPEKCLLQAFLFVKRTIENVLYELLYGESNKTECFMKLFESNKTTIGFSHESFLIPEKYIESGKRCIFFNDL